MPRNEYVAGDEYIAADPDVVGAVWNAMRQAAGSARTGGQVVTRGALQAPFSRPPLPAAPVQATTASLRSYMGFGFLSWGPAETADKAIIVEPQESFRGERLILDVGAAGGTSAGLSLLRRIDVGTQPQSPSVEQPAPAAMFARDSTNAELDLQIAFRGTKVQITLGITAAPGAGVTVTVAIGMFGQCVR